jgi:hypothetical protein
MANEDPPRASADAHGDVYDKQLKPGAAKPERPRAGKEDTPDQQGIEIDNAIERPQEGQPGQRGSKPS